MKMNLWLALPAALTAFALSQPATAAVVTYTYTGAIDVGQDGAGLFGDPGGSLNQLDFTAVFYRDDALALPENIFLGATESFVNGENAFSPVWATLTIAGTTLDIGGLFGEQTQVDDAGFESFGHGAAGLNGGLGMAAATTGTFAPVAGNVLPGPDYHSLYSLTAAQAPTFSWYGNFDFESTPANKDAPVLYTNITFRPTSLVVSPNPGGGVGPVPEPSAWALMILGFGGVGATMRRRRGLAFA